MAITLKQKEAFIDLRAEGHSFDTISKKLKISKPTLIDLQREVSKDINNLLFFKLEAIKEKHRNNFKAKLEGYLRQLEKINNEIEDRDLSEVSFKDLFLAKETLEKNIKSELDKINYSTGEIVKTNFDYSSYERVIGID